MHNIEVICPVYNEGLGLKIFYEKLKNELSKLDSFRYSWKILFVHDPGTDNTLEVIKEISANDNRVMAISMWRRYGIQAALWAGLEASHGDIMITMDADGQHPPELIAEMVHQYEIGNPLVLTKRIEEYRLKVAIFYGLIRLFSQCPPVESHSDFRLMERSVVDTLLKQFKESKPFLRVLMGYWGNVPVISFNANKRVMGTSSFNYMKSYNYLIDAMLAAGHFPFRFVFPFLFVPLLIIGCIFLYYGKVFEAIVLTWLSILGFALGVVALHVETLIAHTRIRPSYLIRERLNVNERKK